jgi:hypothetical protein
MTPAPLWRQDATVTVRRTRQVLHFDLGATLYFMPTTRRRHVITETEQIVRALDDAARRWPVDSGNRAKLLARLVEEGHRAVVEQRERDADARRDAIARTSGALTGVYGDDYLAELRADWPQ